MSTLPVDQDNRISAHVCAGLRARVAAIRKRSVSIGLAAGFVWALSILVVVILAAVWFDLMWELPAVARICAIRVAIGSCIAALALIGWLALRRNRPIHVVRQLDAVGHTGGEIIAGFNLAASSRPQSSISTGLAELAVVQATARAERISAGKVAPVLPLYRAVFALAALGAVIGLVALLLPEFFHTQWNRFASPLDDAPPFSLLKIVVDPGDAEVVYGEGIDIIANTNETPVDDLELVLIGAEGQNEVLPMFSEAENRWRSVLTRIVQPTEYFVRSGRARSEKFRLTLMTIPEIKDVVCQIQPPEYTRRTLTRGPIPAEGIAGLVGTKVIFQATSNRPLHSGEIRFSGETGGHIVAMQPASASSEIVVGQFEIAASGKFELTVTDVDGQTSRQKISGSIVVLHDNKPFVRLTSPRQLSLATPDATVPVTVECEDDYGVSALYLFRSLNDSTPSPSTLLVPGTPVRWVDRSLLVLAEYGLKPGDEVKLFARVEDNDPAGAKGAESPVHSIQIISQMDFDQMRQRQQGFEAVMAKYRQIQRELEALAEANRELEKALRDKPTSEKPDANSIQKLDAAEKQVNSSADALRMRMAQKIPLDVDQEINERLKKMADELDEIAKELEALKEKAKSGSIDNAELQREIERLAKKMGGQREDFGQQVMQPMNDLSKAVDLLSKQNTFVQLVLRQRDLAERAKSLRDFENGDDPDAKRRLREMAEEQATLSRMLQVVLAEIEFAADTLPQIEEFEELRQSAWDFVTAVEGSGAEKEMERAELGFAEFSGGTGYRHADEAATILEKFLSQCNAMGESTCNSCKLRFNPGLGCPNLGNSMQQIGQMFGMNMGGQGTGAGGQGGFSQQRSTMDNIGLYGNEPMSDQTSEAGRGERDANSAGGVFSGGNAGGNRSGESIGTEKTRGGSSSGAIPSRYEQRAGEYFRRIADETGK